LTLDDLPFVAGLTMFFCLDLLPQAAFIGAAVADSVWMVAVGIVLDLRRTTILAVGTR